MKIATQRTFIILRDVLFVWYCWYLFIYFNLIFKQVFFFNKSTTTYWVPYYLKMIKIRQHKFVKNKSYSIF